jgi:hypothetical protein
MASRRNAPAKPGASGAGPIVQTLSLISRAVQRVRAYPDGNPLVAEAIQAAHRALTALDRESLAVRVTPRTLLVDDAPVAGLPAITELAGHLHQASIGTGTFAREGSARDIAVFCRELATYSLRSADTFGLPDMLQDRGVERVTVTLFERPAILQVSSPIPPAPARRPQPTSTTTGGHLYPPGKGWVRLDPVNRDLTGITLNDLAHLVADPFALAEMLVALSGEPPPATPEEALSSKFEDIATLFRAADPATAEGLLGGLARAVLALDAERRHDLLRSTILPGLLEGRIDATLFRHLPDIDLAESLALLLDLQVAAPGMLGNALDRLELSEERRARVEPLLEQHIASRHAERSMRPGAIDGYDDGRIVVDLSKQKEFKDFSAYDLAIDAATESAIAATRDAIESTAAAEERLQCLVNLVRLQANPETAAALLASMQTSLRERRQASEWRLLAGWIHRLGDLHAELAPTRPEIAEIVSGAVLQLLDETLVAEVMRLAERDGDSHTAARVFGAAGAAIVPALVRVLESTTRPPTPLIVQVVGPHAAPMAEALGEHLRHASPIVVRDVVAILAAAGPGVEHLLGSVLGHAEERIVREACRGLVQIGTAPAMRAIAAHLSDRARQGGLLVDAFWRFPAAVASSEARRLLGDLGFVSAQPRTARLLIRTVPPQLAAMLKPALDQLSAWRLHVWRPSHMMIGFAAAAAGGRIR